MNRQIILRLDLPKDDSKVTDLGCGMGGTMRYLLQNNNRITATGITISDFQKEKGNILLSNYNGKILKEDYNKTSIASESQDGAYAIESLCHGGHSLTSLIEAHRILKKSAKLVIADAFLKRKNISASAQIIYDQLCNNWFLEGLATQQEMKTKLKKAGFTKIKVEDISWRIAPSVLHGPLSFPFYIIWKLLKGEKIKYANLRNYIGGVLSMLLGMHINDCGYYIITAENEENINIWRHRFLGQ